MRFIIVSDVHGRDRVIGMVNRLIAKEEADGVMVLGDITHFGPAEWAGEFLSKLNGTVYAVPGNCDPPGVNDEIKRNAISLHKRKITIEGKTLVGMGGSNPTVFETPFEMREDEIEGYLRPLAEHDMILVTHCPAFGYLDLLPTGKHAGSTAIRKIVDEFQPTVAIAGHIHEARGLTEMRGTTFMNPGPAKDSYAGVLEIGERVSLRLLERQSDG
ncbi:MAG: metallophosphoesterase [Methanomassiliicoccales archaeon]|jgi:Icc-related predicted phosphoesterase